MKHKIWKIKPSPEAQKVLELKKSLGVSKNICALLLDRGVDTFEKAKTFFRPQLSMLHDPFLMKDMDKAVSRLLSAMTSKEQIRVYGDYDVDGASATALIGNYLKQLEQAFEIYIPDRTSEGYGPSVESFKKLIDKNVKLILTVD